MAKAQVAQKLSKPNAKEKQDGALKDRKHPANLEHLTKPTAAFTQALAREIVKNLTSFGQMTSQTFRKVKSPKRTKVETLGDFPVVTDSSVLIDGRIVPIVNSGFMAGTLLIPKFVLAEVQHIADSSDIIRRTKGRRGLDVVTKLRGQKANPRVKLRIIGDDPETAKEVDHKLVELAKRWNVRLLTLDFNLAQLARAQSVKVMNINDLAQAIKVALVPGEEIRIRISHEGKEREQGVGYLDDGTMIIVDGGKDKVGSDVDTVITKVHQTPAGQLFFARLK